LRFAVRWPGNPVASPRSHRMPRGDVLGRVHISVAGVSASHATEQRLALATARCNVPARAAALTGERGINLLHPARRFLLEATYQQSPARCEDALVEACFLAHVTARFGDTSSRRACHITDSQVLYFDHVVPSGEISGDPLGPVLPRVRLASTEPSDALPDPAPTIRARLGARQSAFQEAQPTLPSATEPGHDKHCASRQSRADGYSAIHPDHTACAGGRDRFGDRGESDVPASHPIECDPVRPNAIRDGARPAESRPANLWNPSRADLTAESAYVSGFDRDNAKALIPPRFSPGWTAMSTGEKVCHSVGEVSQRLLLYHLRAMAEPCMLSPCLGKLSALFWVAGRALLTWTPVRLLLYGHVPHKPGVRAVVLQHCALSGGRDQAVTRHSNTLSRATDISEGVRRRIDFGRNIRISASQLR